MHRDRYRTLQKYSNASEPYCSCCKENAIEFLSIDHINGRMGEEGDRKTGYNLIRWLIRNNYPEGFQVLCHNCNQAKGYYGLCPHKGKVEGYV